MRFARFVRWSIAVAACQMLWTPPVLADSRIAAGTFGEARAFVRSSPANGPLDSKFQLLASFPAGWSPFGLIAVNGVLYGSASLGNGNIYAATTSGVLTNLYNFQNAPDGNLPEELTVADGAIYGPTVAGGDANKKNPYGCGTVFAVTFAGTETLRSPFACGKDGAEPRGKLVRYHGALFGTTEKGGAYYSGTFFVAHDDGTIKVLHSFSQRSGGYDPQSGVVALGDTFYGTTCGGGTYDGGTVFAISPAGVMHVIFNFNGADGRCPAEGLTAVNGILYGSSSSGGAYGGGLLFAITPSGTETVLHSFKFGARTPEGYSPTCRLTPMGGELFGTTSDGGAYGDGTIFKVTYAGALTTLHSFHGADGKLPIGELTEIGRSLYGVTPFGGANDSGALFSVTP
jgi:uncharacterized repeat protein (TIGR03803 family)